MTTSNISKSTLMIMGLVALVYIGKYLYQMPRFADGEKAPDFTAYLPSGESITLSDFRGKFVLLDFWGSWCGPCRHENPYLVKLNDKFKAANFNGADGFEIISVGIETKKERWLAAIKKDGLNWKNHVSDFKRLKSPIAMDYGVREIPTKYLLNPNGVIIGVNPSFEELDKVLSGHLK